MKDTSNLIPTVIKIFAGLVIILVGFVVFTEYNNMVSHSLEFAHKSRQIMQDSCKYFAKESFRGSSSNKSFGNAYSIKDSKNNVMVSGKFYEGETEEDVYKNLYDSESARDYIEWLNGEIRSRDSSGIIDLDEKNNSFNFLYKTIIEGPSTGFIGFKTFVTPGNLGFTYLDKTTLEKIFRWKLVNELTKLNINPTNPSQRDRFYTDYDNTAYSGNSLDENAWVKWYGFRIYYNQIEVDVSPANGRCKLFDITDESDQNKLTDWTGVIFSQSQNSIFEEEGYIEANKIDENDLRRFKVLYDIRWSIPMEYEGILPLKQVMTLLDNEEADDLTYGDDIWMSSFKNPVKLAEDEQTLNIVTRSAKGHYVSNEVFTEKFTAGSGHNSYTGQDGKMGNNEDASSYMYDNIKEDSTDKYLGDGKDEVIGLAQKLKFIIIH